METLNSFYEQLGVGEDAQLVDEGIVKVVDTFLDTDDDGDTMYCRRESGPCKAMETSGYTPKVFCGGCNCLVFVAP